LAANNASLPQAVAPRICRLVPVCFWEGELIRLMQTITSLREKTPVADLSEIRRAELNTGIALICM
jgi:hypothetical protein